MVVRLDLMMENDKKDIDFCLFSMILKNSQNNDILCHFKFTKRAILQIIDSELLLSQSMLIQQLDIQRQISIHQIFFLINFFTSMHTMPGILLFLLGQKIWSSLYCATQKQFAQKLYCSISQKTRLQSRPLKLESETEADFHTETGKNMNLPYSIPMY